MTEESAEVNPGPRIGLLPRGLRRHGGDKTKNQSQGAQHDPIYANPQSLAKQAHSTRQESSGSLLRN